jgi:hypothetical protein
MSARSCRSTAPGEHVAYHNWRHLAQFHLDRGDVAEELRLFDEDISGGGFGQALELVDGSALLWRLHALGHPVGDHWRRLAEGWRARIATATTPSTTCTR